MSTEDTYLHSVERMLRGIAPARRTAVLDDLRAHFADAAEVGRPVDDVIRGLGTPREIAERAHEELGAASDVETRAEFAWRMLQWSAVGLAVVTGAVAAFVMPSYTEAISGLWLALIALVPAVVAVVPLIVPRRLRVTSAVVAAVLLTVMALIGGFTLGGFFLPTATLSWAALIVWIRLRGSGFGIGWRIAGAVLAALPIVLSLPLFGIGMPGRYADGASPDLTVSAWAWPFLVAIVLIATLIGIGYRAAGWALAAIGLTVLVAGLFLGQLLTLLFIWVGGWWLTIGLAHAVSTTRRR